MAAVSCWNASIFVIYLSVVCTKLVELFDFVILVCIDTRYYNWVVFEWIEGALKDVRCLGTCQSYIDGSENLIFVPLPKNKQPVWFSCKRNQMLFFISRRKAAWYKLLGRVIATIWLRIGHVFLLSLSLDVIDCAPSSVGTFTYCQILFLRRNRNGSYSFGALSTC